MKNIMKLAVVAVFTVALVPVASAQTNTATGVGQAQSSSGSQSGSQANNQIIFGDTPSETTSTLKTAPPVQAPSVFGGGHPCLAGKSGGISVIGGGISYGQGDPEIVCMLMVLGQPEAAIRALVMSNARACEALNGVGYYRVGNQVVPFKCGEQRKIGGVDTAGVQARKTRVSTSGNANRPQERPKLFDRCYMRDDGKVGIIYTSTGRANKKIAKNACLSQLGY